MTAARPPSESDPPGDGDLSARPVADLRLVAPAGAGWAAAWWSTGASPLLGTALAAGALVVAVLAALLLPRLPGPSAAVLLAAAAVVATAGVAAAAVHHRASGPVPAWAREGVAVEVTGRAAGDARKVVGGPVRGADRYVLRVEVDEVRGRDRTVRVGLPVLVLGDASWAGVTAGQGVGAVGRLRAAEAGDDVVALLAAYGGPRSLTPGSWPWRLADRVRAGLRAASGTTGGDAGTLLPSLVVGDTSMLSTALRDDLRTAGLTHLTAVSGANVAIVTGSVLWAAGAAGASRRGRLLLAGLATAGFVVLARPQPSVLRAAAMGAVALLALAGARRPRGVPVLCGAVLTLLVIDPWLSRSAGFALSSAATAALLLLAPPWTDRLSRWMPRPLALALAAPAAAQAACGPLVVLLQPAVSLVAVPANLLAEPAVAPATVLGLVAAAAAQVWLPAGSAVAWIAGSATGWIALVAHRAAALPWAQVPWPSGLPGAALLLVLTAAAVRLTLAGRGPPGASDAGAGRRGVGRRGAGRAGAGRAGAPSWARRAVPPAAGVAVAAVLGWGLVPRLPGGAGTWPGTSWTVAMCDVGQGDATVLRSGADRAVLVDAGPEPAAVDGCLRRLGVRHLDLVLLTHDHADHVLGLPGALAGRTVTEILGSPLHAPSANAVAVDRWARAAGVTVQDAVGGRAGTAAADGYEVRWTVLVPGAAALPRDAAALDAEGADGTVVNEASVVMGAVVRGPGGDLRVLALGDLEEEGQHRLVGDLLGASGSSSRVDVVKVAHHGSAKQVDELYTLLSARVGLVGVGRGNDYGHPASSALRMLERSGTTVLRTDRDGDLALVPRPGGGLEVRTRGP